MTYVVTVISIVSAISGFLIGTFGLIRKMIEFVDSVNSVINHVDRLDERFESTHNDIYDRLHEHDEHLVKHDEQLKTLLIWKNEKN